MNSVSLNWSQDLVPFPNFVPLRFVVENENGSVPRLKLKKII